MAENANGINGDGPASTELQWKCGFMNTAGCYLTAESFGFKLNASGNALKKKQIWTIVQHPDQNFIYIKSHLNRYMMSDHYGAVSVEAEDTDGDNADALKFVVEYSTDGKWAIKNAKYLNYLKGTSDHVKCHDKSPCKENWWSIQLSVHPQVNLYSPKFQRYAHLNKEQNEIQVAEDIPWGADSMITLDFVDGKYTMKTCDNRFLNRDGGLDEKSTPGDDNKFLMEIHSGCLAFKDSEGRYLTAVGKGGVMKGRNKKVSKDEHFTIEDSHPQVTMLSHTGKLVSIKQGEDISANQLPNDGDDELKIADTEIFQLEYIKKSDCWAMRTHKGTYWALQSDKGSVIASSKELKKEGHFTIKWLDNGKVGIKGHDGKYLSNKPSGVLFPASDTLEKTNMYTITLVNRPLLVLKSEFGFVGLKDKSEQYSCNRSNYDTIEVIPTGKGSYNLKALGGKYLGIGDDKMVCLDDGPSEFFFQFVGQSMMAIKASNGCFLKGEQNGLFRAASEEIASNTLWEY